MCRDGNGEGVGVGEVMVRACRNMSVCCADAYELLNFIKFSIANMPHLGFNLAV